MMLAVPHAKELWCFQECLLLWSQILGNPPPTEGNFALLHVFRFRTLRVNQVWTNDAGTCFLRVNPTLVGSGLFQPWLLKGRFQDSPTHWPGDEKSLFHKIVKLLALDVCIWRVPWGGLTPQSDDDDGGVNPPQRTTKGG